MRGISRLTGLGAVVLTSVLTALVVLAFHDAAPLVPASGGTQVDKCM